MSDREEELKILTRLMFFAESGAGGKGTAQFTELKVATVCFVVDIIGRNRSRSRT